MYRKLWHIAAAYAVLAHPDLRLTVRLASPLRESVKECQPVLVVEDFVCPNVQDSRNSDCDNVEDDYVVSCNRL